MCPGSRNTSSPRARSHSQTAPSRPAVARREPSGWTGDGEDFIGVPAQYLALAALHLPQADGVIPTARGEPAAVGTEGGPDDAVLVTAESGNRLVRPRIQEQDRLLIRGHDGQPTAVGTVRQRRAFGREERLAGRNVAHVQVTTCCCPRRTSSRPLLFRLD